jgi:hypothetical protein
MPKQAKLRTSKSTFHQQNRLSATDCANILKKDLLVNIDHIPKMTVTQIHPLWKRSALQNHHSDSASTCTSKPDFLPESYISRLQRISIPFFHGRIFLSMRSL